MVSAETPPRGRRGAGAMAPAVEELCDFNMLRLDGRLCRLSTICNRSRVTLPAWGWTRSILARRLCLSNPSANEEHNDEIPPRHSLAVVHSRHHGDHRARKRVRVCAEDAAPGLHGARGRSDEG